MHIRKFAAVSAGLATLLCACGAPVGQEPAAASAPVAAPAAHTPATAAEKTARLREEFIRTCTEAAAREGHSANQEPFAQACRCTFDDTAKQYGSEAALAQALNDYDSGKSDGDGLEAKMTSAANRCADRLLPE